MKRSLLLACFLIPMLVQAQTFTFTADSLTVNGMPGKFFDIYGDIVNVSSQDLSIRIVRTQNTLPAGWSSSMCNGILCYPPFADTISVPDLGLGVPALAPGDTSEFHLNIPSIPNIGGTAIVTVKVENLNDPSESRSLTFTASTEPTGLEPGSAPLSGTFRLMDNYPNPFNPSTVIPFEIASAQSEQVRLTVYNAVGAVVTTLVDEPLSAGSYEATWDGMDNAGRIAPSGIYFYELLTQGQRQSQKMLLVK
ncbi:MAG: FlgD immunoglobulin-like domain containing protein [Calditrichota bacterium]